MAFAIEVALSAEQEMTELPVFEHRRIVDAIEQQLSGEPEKPTRNRKCLGDGMTADFEYVPPLWQLRVGEYRVFYEVNAAALMVVVLAVRKKPPDKTTAEVLNEKGKP